ITSSTSEIASFDSSIPPSTHCSAAMSCGGVRSNPPSLGAISVTLTKCHLPLAGEHSRGGPRGRSHPFYRMARTVSRQRVPASSRAVHRPVDSLCRHAADAVRSLGIPLWKWLGNTFGHRFCLRLRHPLLVLKKHLLRPMQSTMAGSYPHWEFDVERYMAAVTTLLRHRDPAAAGGVRTAARRSWNVAAGTSQSGPAEPGKPPATTRSGRRTARSADRLNWQARAAAAA